MKRSTSLGSGRRALRALLVTALSLGTVAAVALPATAVTTGPDPAAAGVSINITPTTGLVNGQAITYTVSAPASLAAVSAHICQDSGSGTPAPYDDASFGYTGTTGIRCIEGNHLDAGSLTGGDYEKNDTFSGSASTSGPLTFHAGTSATPVQWHNDNGFQGIGGSGLACNAGNPCRLVVQAVLNPGGNVYFSQTLTYAGQPDAPTTIATHPQDGAVNVSFAAGASNGNSPIDHFTVTAGAPCVVSCSANTPNGTTFNATVGGLTNFQSYPFTVTATNSAGFTSAAGGPVNGTPTPPAPTGVSGTAAASTVNLSWSFAGTPTGLTEFRITPYDDSSGHVAQAPVFTGSTATSFAVTPLVNGHPYSFTVAGHYGGANFTADSTLSSDVVPTNKEVDQAITVNRPQGDLVLTQACDTSNPTPYPVDANGVPNPVYPTADPIANGACSVSLGNATFVTAAGVPAQPTPAASGNPGYPTVGEGQFFKADGAIHQVAIVDTRDSDIGWTVNGKLKTDFTSASQHFSAHQLGWQPAVTDQSPPFTTPDGSYNMAATRGSDALPANTAALTGLGSSRVLASATTGHGLGLAHLDALLHVLIPVFAQHGVYTAVLQITAI